MAIVKISKSKKSVLFIDDDGRVYCTSISFLLGVINSKSMLPTILTRLPFNVEPTRFKKSPLYNPDNIDLSSVEGFKNDGLSINRLKEVEDKKKFEDKLIW